MVKILNTFGKRAVIISGGYINDYTYTRQLIKETDYVICADSGYDHALKMGLRVDLCIGDFDSAMNIPPKEIAHTYPAKKNFTDTELALNSARELGFNDFLFLAVTGSRMDHTLANVLLLKTCAERNETACAINENNTMYVLSGCNKTLELNVAKGQIVSLVPLSKCRGVSTIGLEYPLTDAALSVGTSLGISNIAFQTSISIAITSGCLLIILAKD